MLSLSLSQVSANSGLTPVAVEDEMPGISPAVAKLCLPRGPGIKLKDASRGPSPSLSLFRPSRRVATIHYFLPLLILIRLDSFISLNFLENPTPPPCHPLTPLDSLSRVALSGENKLKVFGRRRVLLLPLSLSLFAKPPETGGTSRASTSVISLVLINKFSRCFAPPPDVSYSPHVRALYALASVRRRVLDFKSARRPPTSSFSRGETLRPVCRYVIS